VDLRPGRKKSFDSARISAARSTSDFSTGRFVDNNQKAPEMPIPMYLAVKCGVSVEDFLGAPPHR